MQHALDKYEKYASKIFFIIMILCLIPMALFGKYNYPCSDDFYYGYKAALVWQETGNIFQTLFAAISGVAEQYFAWQGTYSAMFLMHLPPQMWSGFFYQIYPTLLFAFFAGAVFYLFHALLCTLFQASKDAWILVSSLFVILCVEQVPLCGQTFYWYNGSMYYTGFLCGTFFFFGLLIKNLCEHTWKRTILLSLLGIFLAGGNYVSLLPTMIILVLTILYQLYLLVTKKVSDRRKLISLIIIFACILGGFLISALAPGNSMRQEQVWPMSPFNAVKHSIVQNTRYCLYWNGVGAVLFYMLITPVFLRIVQKCTWTFRFPIIICGLIFGVYCSTSCPSFYAQSSAGPARIFCLVYYMMNLTVTLMYFYFLGAVTRFVASGKFSKKALSSTSLIILCEAGILLVFALLSFVRPLEETLVKPHSLTAIQVMTNGDAAYYEAQYLDRLAVLEDPDVSDAVLEPYDVPASLTSLIFITDVYPNENELLNQAVAEYYHKNSVKLKK